MAIERMRERSDGRTDDRIVERDDETVYVDRGGSGIGGVILGIAVLALVAIIACPSCARQGFEVIKTVETLEQRLAHIATPMSLSIIGCVVNGPGEALFTDIGFTGGGKGAGMVYLAGKPDHKMDNAQMVDHIVSLVEAKARDIEAEKAHTEAKTALQAAE